MSCRSCRVNSLHQNLRRLILSSKLRLIYVMILKNSVNIESTIFQSVFQFSSKQHVMILNIYHFPETSNNTKQYMQTYHYFGTLGEVKFH